MAKKTVAIVGRPNVGKSTLFNKLVGKRVSIVLDTPGVTRDRIYADCEWRGKKFMLVDTGGIEITDTNDMFFQMRTQAEIAIERADMIIFLTDLTAGVTAADKDVATKLRMSGKPILLAVSKCDYIGQAPPELYEFYNLGIGDPYPVSGTHGHGTGDLLDAVYDVLGELGDDGEEDEDSIKVAIIGKPNSGKSSLLNRLAGEERAIVSDVAGTTRDTLDSIVENTEGKFTFIDTAGLRRKSRVYDQIEKYSVLRCQMAVERADVCVIMVDATEGVTEQDTKVAGLAHESGKGCIIVVNKWDLIEKDTHTMDKFKKDLDVTFAFMSYAPYLFISAKTGQRVDRLFELIKYVNDQNSMRISTGILNDLLAEATARVQPPTDKGRRLKIYYMTQASVRPPTFVCFCNNAELFHYSYQRYLENQIRATFGLEGTPVKMIIRERGDEK